MSRLMAKRLAGFTLLEVLVVMAILAILVGMALPGYRSYLERGHRAQAIHALHSISACQERLRAASGYYDTSRCLEGIDQQHYTFGLKPRDEAASLAFTAIATPINPSKRNRCGSLAIDQAGSTTISGETQWLAACWGGR